MKEILLCETSSPPSERIFTWFKHSQRDKEEGRPPNSPREEALLERWSIPDLTDAGLGHTRMVIDRQIGGGLLGGWRLLAFGALGYATAVAIVGIP